MAASSDGTTSSISTGRGARIGTGRGARIGTGTGAGAGTAAGNGWNVPITWTGAHSPSYSAATYSLYQSMMNAWVRYQQARRDSREERDAKAEYDVLRQRFNFNRANGARLYPHQSIAIERYLDAYQRYQRAPRDSIEEELTKIEYEEADRDVQALGGDPLYSVGVKGAFENYVELYERYLLAPTDSVEEVVAKSGFEMYKRQLERQYAWGNHFYATRDSARSAYYYWHQQWQSAPSDSAAENVAKLRMDLAEREMSSLWFSTGTGDGNLGLGTGTGTGSGGGGSLY